MVEGDMLLLKHALVLTLLATPALGNGDKLSQYLWQARPLVVFAPSENDPRLQLQLQFIEDRRADLDERDVVVLIDTAEAEGSALRDELHPRDFQLVLIGKDGGVKLRKPFPWDVREISRVIDKMPMRREELRRRAE